MIDFTLFRDRSFSAGVATALIASAALMGMELVVSQRLQLVVGLSPLQAGLTILPIPSAPSLPARWQDWHCRAWAPNAFSVHRWASPQPEPCSTCWATAPRTGFSWSRSPCSVSASVRQ